MTEADQERSNLARRGQDIEVATKRKAFSEASKNRQAAADARKSEQSGMLKRTRIGALSNLAASGKIDQDSDEFKGALYGGGDSAGPKKPQRMSMADSRKRRLLNESQYTKSKQRYLQSHSAEARRGRRIEFQAAPDSPTLLARPGEARGAGQIAREHRDAYESAIPSTFLFNHPS